MSAFFARQTKTVDDNEQLHSRYVVRVYTIPFLSSSRHSILPKCPPPHPRRVLRIYRNHPFLGYATRVRREVIQKITTEARGPPDSVASVESGPAHVPWGQHTPGDDTHAWNVIFEERRVGACLRVTTKGRELFSRAVSALIQSASVRQHWSERGPGAQQKEDLVDREERRCTGNASPALL
ncbi:hypothetical protein ACLOJK_033309 [Asimina triloba]